MFSSKMLDSASIQNGVKDLINTAKIRIKALNEEISLMRSENSELVGVYNKIKQNKEDYDLQFNEINKEIHTLRDVIVSLGQIKEDKQTELIKKKQLLLDSLEKSKKLQDLMKEKGKQVELAIKLDKEEKEHISYENYELIQNIKRNIDKMVQEITRKKREIASMKSQLKTRTENNKKRAHSLSKEKNRLIKFVTNL